MRNATERKGHFELYTAEIEGYMSILLGFLFGENSIVGDIESAEYMSKIIIPD